MKINLYAVRDVKADAAMKPLLFERDEIAIRQFELTVVAADNPMSLNPEDYVLYKIGVWDDVGMYIEPMDPLRLITGLEAYSNRKLQMEKIEALNRQIDFITNQQNGESENAN